MAENSKIEWTDHTFNPWTGCTKVSPGCDHCYAEGWSKRSGHVEWGPHGERRRTSAANWKKPQKWNAEAEASGIRRKVFCASLADVFDNHPSILPEWREDLWGLIASTPHLDWLLLTKRPGNIARMLPKAKPEEWELEWGNGWPNVWLGTTVENQTEADRRIPHLLAAPAAVRFLSVEPLLGPVNIAEATKKVLRHPSYLSLNLDWIICGGESGPGARPMHPDWARSLRDQCVAAGVPFFFKQWGKWLHESQDPDALWDWSDADDRGILHHWLDPEMVTASIPLRGKSAGRLLDGREWNQMPGDA